MHNLVPSVYALSDASPADEQSIMANIGTLQKGCWALQVEICTQSEETLPQEEIYICSSRLGLIKMEIL